MNCQCSEPYANESGGDHDAQQWPTPLPAILPEGDQISQAEDRQKKGHHLGHRQAERHQWDGDDAKPKPETTFRNVCQQEGRNTQEVEPWIADQASTNRVVNLCADALESVKR